MKRYLATVVLMLVLAGLAGYLYWVELPSERAKEQAEAQQKQLVPFEQSAITRVTVRSSGAEIVLVPEDRSWKLLAPLQAEADRREVEAFLRALVLGRVTRVVEENPSTLAPFGLDQPSTVITLAVDGTEETIALGDSGPISSTLYAQRKSDGQVLLTDLAAKDVLNKTVLTFRKKELLQVDHTQVDRLRLTYPGSEFVLYRSDGSKEKKWRIRFPVESAADQVEIRTLLFKLEGLRALGFVDPGSERDRLAARLSKPEVKLTIHTPSGDQQVKLYQPDPGSGEAYAVTSPDAPIYRVSPSVIRDLQKDLFTLQDKRLLGLDRAEIGILRVKTRDREFALVNQTGTWVLEDQPEAKVNQEVADLFVSRVADLPAEIRVLKQPGPLAPYGLVSPTAEFTALALDGKRQGRLLLGNKVNGLVYAIGQGLTGIFQSRRDLLDQIPTKEELLAKSAEK